MLYARLNDAGTAFEPQRNLMRASHVLDGGGTVAAGGRNVYVAWHGLPVEGRGARTSAASASPVPATKARHFAAQAVHAALEATGQLLPPRSEHLRVIVCGVASAERLLGGRRSSLPLERPLRFIPKTGPRS